jgi:CheY-like chemotaxis protein
MTTDDVEGEGSRNYTVLVVDDEPDMRYLLRAILESVGYAVVEAPHGEAALEQVQSAPPDIVLTDRMMPRMGGGELIRRLKSDERTKAIPILMVSGANGDEPRADAVLGKPFESSELIAVVDRLIGKVR